MAAQAAANETEDYSKDSYGDLPLIQSADKPDRVLASVKNLVPDIVGEAVWLRGRLHTSRSKGYCIQEYSFEKNNK